MILFLTELKVIFYDLSYWLIQILQPCLIVLLVIFLIQGASLDLQAAYTLKVVVFWLMGLWIQLALLHVIWRADPPVFAWRMSDYPVSLFMGIKSIVIFLCYIVPCAVILKWMLINDAHYSIILHFLMSQWICLMLSMVFGFMLRSQQQMTHLGILFILPIYLPIMLIAASPELVAIHEVNHFVNNVLLAGCTLSLVLMMVLFDRLLSRLN